VQDWILPDETYSLTPSLPGTYSFLFGTKEGRKRWMKMNVADCSLQKP
jgi:hypothetical protein